MYIGYTLCMYAYSIYRHNENIYVYVKMYMHIYANHKLQHKRWNSVTECMLLCIFATRCMFLCVAKHLLEQGKFLFDKEEKNLHLEELALEKGPRNSQLTFF